VPDFADSRVELTGTFTEGTVASAIGSDKTVLVTMGGVNVTCRANRDMTAAIGDRVLVAHDGTNRWVLMRTRAAAPTVVEDDKDPVPPPKPAIVKGSTTFSPVETRSYRAAYGWRTDNSDVYQGVYGAYGVLTGCAFYGKGPASLKGSTVLSATIKAKRLTAGDFAARTTTLRLVTQKTRPGGAPTLTSSATGPRLAVGKSGTFAVPTGWAQAIVDGTSGGLAIFDSSGSPYVRLAGKGSYSAAFSLTIKWQR
jgi:hypothetical protein